MKRTSKPPRFAVDRALGKTVPQVLTEHGWDVVIIQDVFADDAQQVSDSEWIEWANDNADAALTKDAAIHRQASYRLARIPVFALANQQLLADTMAALFLEHQTRIWNIARSAPGRAFYRLHTDGGMVKDRDATNAPRRNRTV